MSDMNAEDQERRGKKISLTTDDDGNQSMMRVLSLVCVGAAIFFGLILAFYQSAPEAVENLVLIFLVAGIGGKSGQKVVEVWGKSQKN